LIFSSAQTSCPTQNKRGSVSSSSFISTAGSLPPSPPRFFQAPIPIFRSLPLRLFVQLNFHPKQQGETTYVCIGGGGNTKRAYYLEVQRPFSKAKEATVLYVHQPMFRVLDLKTNNIVLQKWSNFILRKGINRSVHSFLPQSFEEHRFHIRNRGTLVRRGTTTNSCISRLVFLPLFPRLS